jgi:hypothetical protein
MRLLVDTDAFCKLGAAGLFEPLLVELGLAVGDCRRLPALPHMLRRGKLVKQHGAAVCASLLPMAESIKNIPEAAPAWLDRFVDVTDIDPGEAQLFAVACEHGAPILSSDKRALRALAGLPDIVTTLAGRIVTVEGSLLLLCVRRGEQAVRDAVGPTPQDKVLKICFSPSNPTPKAALRSYFDSLQSETAALRLWDPDKEGTDALWA